MSDGLLVTTPTVLDFSLGARPPSSILREAIMLSESQFRFGDISNMGQRTGAVECIALYEGYLRDNAARLSTIPTGDIRTTANPTLHWMQATGTFNVDSEASLAHPVRGDPPRAVR